MPIKATDLKRGQALIFNGQLNTVIGTEHVKPGKGPAYVQAKMKNVETRPSRSIDSTPPTSSRMSARQAGHAVSLRQQWTRQRSFRLHGRGDPRPDGNRFGRHSRGAESAAQGKPRCDGHDLRRPPPGCRSARIRGIGDHGQDCPAQARPRPISSRRRLSRPVAWSDTFIEVGRS